MEEVVVDAAEPDTDDGVEVGEEDVTAVTDVVDFALLVVGVVIEAVVVRLVPDCEKVSEFGSRTSDALPRYTQFGVAPCSTFTIPFT